MPPCRTSKRYSKVSPGGMPGKLMPGTPSIPAGRIIPCQWIELSHAEPVGHPDRHPVPLAPAQRRRRQRAADDRRGALPAGEVDRQRTDVEIEPGSAELRRVAAPGRSARRRRDRERRARASRGPRRLPSRSVGARARTGSRGPRSGGAASSPSSSGSDPTFGFGGGKSCPQISVRRPRLDRRGGIRVAGNASAARLDRRGSADPRVGVSPRFRRDPAPRASARARRRTASPPWRRRSAWRRRPGRPPGGCRRRCR